MTTTLPATSRTEFVAPAPEPPARAAPKPGSVWRRAAARVVDLVTVLFINLALVLGGLAAVVDRASTRWSPEPWGRAFVATVTYSIILLVYEVVFLALRGQTPGKDLFNLKVVEAATFSRPRWWVALIRTLPIVGARIVPGALAGTLAIGVLGVATPFGARRRGLHDRLARTIVISFDSTAMEPETVAEPIDRRELAAKYGPRSLADVVNGRRR